MKYYVYKSYNLTSLFQPNDLALEPFSFPKSCKSFLNNNVLPLIYIFNNIPSNEIIEEYKLEKSLEIDEVKDLQDLKNFLHQTSIWKIIAMF